jgi:hypothetical protein
MSAIRPEDFLRFFEANGIRFIDAVTGKPALDVLREQNCSKPAKKSDFDLWLEEQDQAPKLEQKTGEF